MSNRQERRHRIMRTEDDEAALLTAQQTLKVDGDRLSKLFDRDPLEEAVPGEHYWVMFMTHRVNPATLKEGETHFDLESLVMVVGPGCYLCEMGYKEGRNIPCPGPT